MMQMPKPLSHCLCFYTEPAFVQKQCKLCFAEIIDHVPSLPLGLGGEPSWEHHKHGRRPGQNEERSRPQYVYMDGNNYEQISLYLYVGFCGCI